VKIVTLTLNPALDKSSTVDHLVPEQKMRCGPLRLDAGGGGINVSKGIRKLGGESVAVFPTGGATGLRLQAILNEAGIETKVSDGGRNPRKLFRFTMAPTNLQYRFTLPGLKCRNSRPKPVSSIVANCCNPEYLVASGSLPPGSARYIITKK
jgi:6-phosphofructokinase 2